jgi:Zn-dependent peptidase ImmA (M78 family)
LTETNVEDVEEQANYIRESFNLGHYPAVTLSKTLEDYYGVKFLQFDYGNNAGSAASTKSDFGVCILVNKSEIPWRQNFSVAHELFHLLTWDEKLFKTNEENEEFKQHNEDLANAFAAELLMPEESIAGEIRKIAPDGECQFTDLVIIARKFDVSTKALLTRLESLGFIKTETKEQLLKEPDFKDLDQKSKLKDYCAAKRLGERFIRMAYQAYARGKISRARLAEIMDVPLGSLKRHLEENGLPESASHEITLCHS